MTSVRPLFGLKRTNKTKALRYELFSFDSDQIRVYYIGTGIKDNLGIPIEPYCRVLRAGT